MSRSYPIWNKVTSCIYKSFKGYGVKDTGEVTICVGSSAKNSHDFIDTIMTRRKEIYKGKEVIVFSYSCDGEIIKRMIFDINAKGQADTPIKVMSKLSRIKSLKLK